ncbi:MAG: transcription antitermination factor NusB [Saprospiraceae bacterium]|nr:transcription antitermination factor NusB [Saprospiraceae bacterium]
MQVLYAMNRDSQITYQQASVRYKQSIDRSYELFLFHLHQMLRILAYAKKDAASKSSKLLPSDYDKQFTDKLYENDLVQSLVNNNRLSQAIKKYKLDGRIDPDITRKLYSTFSKSEEYTKYIRQNDSQKEDHEAILLELYRNCIASELFVDRVEDHYNNWIDDKSLVVGSIKKVLKALPAEEDFLDEFIPNEETVKVFGEKLLSQVCEENEELLAIIEPSLNNWDVDRVAVIDMILLKMALCELLYFKSIPTKVTLNEFVEISKLYSTDKSKDFINGILDRLMKELAKEGKIKKEGRGLME